MAYLNPNTIVLDDFSTPEYVQADFLIENAGTMNFLEIVIDRTTSTVTKSTIDNITWGNNASLMLSNDLNIPNYIQLNSNHQNSMLHTSFLTETSPQSLIKGIVFAICVKNIFNLDDSQISNIDFVQDNDRLNSIFFDNDPTITLVNDVLNASQNDFNRTLTSDGTNDDEYAYWDTRIGPSNDSIIFVDDDKMYSFYGLRLKLIAGTTPIMSGTTISNIGNQLTPPEFYNNDGNELYFVMGWNVQVTGFGEGNASSGPKQNWNVEFLDINNGEPLYNGIIKTDSNGSFFIPQHAINAEVFEISVSCIDSSGFDTLTDEQSEIGENFTAIGTSETGLISQATPLSSVLAEGFKETGNFNLTSYKNIKSSYESAFGISDININPYDTEVDDTNATINSSKILEIEALTDGMRTVLSENSSMSRSNIQKKIRKAISQKLTSPNIDFTNTTIISDMIQTAATEVVDNGTNIVTLRNKATGLASSVNYIKTTFHSHSSSNRNTRLFELHKSLTSVKNTFKASPNFNTNITSSITNHRNILNVSKFNVPSRSLWKRKWDVRFVSNPPVFINQDATYTYTPIAKGSVQQHTPIIVIFKPSWLNWNGKTLSGTPDNSHVGSHSVILKSIEGNKERNQSFAITVNNINDTPTFTNSPPAIIDIANQSTYSYTPTVNDIDVGDSLTIISVTDLTNSWLTWDGTTLKGSPNYSQIGTYSIHLRVTDNGLPQRSGNIHFTIQVISTNSPPTFTSTPSAIIDEDSEYNYTPNASDVNLNDTLNFSVPTKPSWLNWNGTKLNGIPRNNDIGNHNVTIRVNDGTIHVDQSFIITVNAVNDAPIFTSNPPAIVDEDTLYTYTPTASDEEGDSLTFSLHSSNAKGPAWLNWDGTTLSGTPTNDNIGNTTVTIRASDGAINVDQSFTITVNNVNDAPVFTTIPNATIYTDEDSLYTYTPTANDIDVGDNVSINLHSSNETGPAWLNWDGTTLSGTPTNDNVGNTTVTIRASDGAIHVDQSFTITVNNVNDPPVFTSTPSNSVIDNTTYSYTPTAIDVDLNYSLSFSIVTKPNFLTWNGTTLSGVPSNNTGVHNIIIRVTDGIVNVDQTFTLEVNRYIFETRTSLVTAVNAWTTNSTTAAAIYGPINDWDVSQVTNMSDLFKNKTTFNSNISGWDVSNVTIMNNMFYGASSFNQSLNNWNTAKVSNMNYMFNEASSYNSSLNDWNTAKVTTMERMFRHAESFNKGLNSWNTSKVTNMKVMFSNAHAFNQDLNNWNVSKVANMEYMFSNAYVFNGNISGWNVSNLTYAPYLFSNARKFNQNISGWNVSKLSNMVGMFQGTTVFNQNISTWNVQKINKTGVSSSAGNAGIYGQNANNHSDYLFRTSNLYYFKVKQTPLTNSNIQAAVDSALNNGNSVSEYGGHISNWDVSSVTDMQDLFRNKSSFNENISGWNVSEVTNMAGMFRDATNFNQPMSGWNMSKVINTSSMFRNTSFNQYIGSWNVSKVTDMNNMFRENHVFNQNISNWDVSSVKNMASMLLQCHQFNQPLNNWDVSSVTNVSYMFRLTEAFNQPLNNWDTSSMINITAIFNRALAFNQDISVWDVSKISSLKQVFHGASAFNQNISSWDVSNVTNYTNYGLETNAPEGSHSNSLFTSSSQYYFTVNNVAPVFTSSPLLTCMAGLIYSYTPTATDQNLDSITFSLHTKNEKGPAWLNWNGTTLSGRPASGNVGNTTVTLRITDGEYNVDQSFTIQVTGSTKLVMKVSGITQFDAPFYMGIGIIGQPLILPYMIIRRFDNNSIEDEGEMTSKTGLNSSILYKLEMILPIPNLNTVEEWGIYFKGNALATNNSLDITSFGGMPLFKGGGSASNTDGYGEQFYGFNGQISATDAPSIRINTNLRKAFCHDTNTTHSSFQGHVSSGQALNLSNWDLSNVICSANMFKNCTNLGDGFDVIINNWNLSNSNFNDRIFENAFGYNKGSYNSGNISINNWNIREDTSYMFHRCNGFDGDLSGWTITDPTHMEAMFSQCTEFTGIGLSSWIVTSPTQIGYSMDSFCKDCNSLGLNQHIDISQPFPNKFGTDNLGKLGTGASMIWTDISYWAIDESDNTIIVASFHNTYYSFIKINLDGTYVSNTGKYEYTAASGQNNGVAPSTYNSQSQLVSDYNGATDVVGSPRDFQKGPIFDIIKRGTWDYTYCTDLGLAFYRCGCLGINSNSSFKMDGCNFANLTSSNGMKETFRESFGNSSYTNGNSYPNLSNNVSLRDWNIVGPSSTGVSLAHMFYNCKKFDGDLSNWRITNPSTMASMLRTQNNEFTGSFLSSWTVTSPAQIAYSMNSFLRDSRSLGLNQHIDISDFSNAGLFSYDPKGITFNGTASVIDVSSECKVACYVPCNSVTNPNNGDIGKGMWFDESTWIAVFGHEPLGDSLVGPVVVYRNNTRIYYGDLAIFDATGFNCAIHPAGIHSWGNQERENGFWQIGDLIAPARNESLYPNIPNGILGNASRTIVATIKTTSTASNNSQFICGYGTWGTHNQVFGIRLRNNPAFGGNSSDKYVLGLCGWGNDFHSNFQITANVETTIAVSYNSQNKTTYFFKKEANSTTWTMDVVFDRYQSGVTDPLNTTLGKGFMIGGFPTTGDPANPFIGTIRHVKGFNFACTKIQDVQEKIGSWDYTYCTDLRYAFYRCGCLGINSNSSFKMDGCQFTNLTSSDGMKEAFRESFGHSSYTNGNTYFPEFINSFNITNVNTVTKDGVNISSNIQYTQGWNTFILKTLYPSNSDFYTKEYTIDWEDDPVSYNHGGYYLTYNGLNNFSSDFVRYGGPIWWWYAGEESYSGSTQIKWREGTDKWPNTMFGSQEVWDQFRKKHTLKFKFIDNTNWKITYIINGFEHSQTIPTHGGWTFEDKASIEVRYRMSTSSYVGGITSAHKLTFYDSSDTSRVSLRNWRIWRPGLTDSVSFYMMFYNSFKFNGEVTGWSIRNPSTLRSMFQSCHEFIGKGISSWIISSFNTYTLQDFCKNCSKFNQSLGFINTGSVNNWSNWLDGATISVDNIEKTFGLWETKTFNGTPTIDFGDSKYNFKGWVSKENIYNKTGVTVGGSALVGGGDGSYVLEAGAGGWNGITNGVNKVTQSPDLWGNLSGYIHDAGQHLFSGDNSIWHGATSNEQEWVQIEFPVEKKISMFRGWYGTYMNPNDRPHTIRLYGSNNNSNYDLLIHLTGLNWSLNGADDYVNMVNYQEFIIPESNQGYYKYYKFELNSNTSWTRFAEFALFSSDVGPAFVIPNVPEKNGIYASFYNTVTNPVVYSYSPIYTKMYPGETYFNGSGNLLDMNMNEVAMMGGGNRTFIATIKTTRSGVESRQFIFGYGSNLQSPDIESFGLYITNRVIDGGNGDNIYVLAAAGLDWFSNLKIYSNIEYTVAISYDGKASSGGWLFIYKKDSITGIWEMDARRLSTHLWTTKGSNHNRHSDRGLAIGCFPYLGGTSTTHLPFFGTINNLTICNYLINTTNNLFTPNSTLNLSVSQKPSWLTLNNSGTQLVGKPPRSNFGGGTPYSTTITLSITNFQNETLNQTMSIDVHAPPDYEDWSWKKQSYPSVATLYLDEPYHYFESERCEKDSVGKKVMTTQELNYIIQNSSRRFKFGTVMAIMYNIDIRTFRNYLGSTIWGDGRILWYIGTDASNRDGDDNDNMHMNFTHHRASKSWSREWMRPRMYYEGDECAFDFRVAREDQAFSRNYDWMIVTSWRDDGGNGSRHVISMSYRPHRAYGLLGKNENGDSQWRAWGAGRWDGQNGGYNYRTDSGVPFWEDQIGHRHDGMWIGGIHRTDKPNRQFPYDCRVLVLKDYFHGFSDWSWRGGAVATQQSQINSVNPMYHA